jgi:hypothetical protein
VVLFQCWQQNYLRRASDRRGRYGHIHKRLSRLLLGPPWHIHFEIYREANTATSFSNNLRTSQIALPTDVCSAVSPSASGYAASITHLPRITFAPDNVFSDGVSSQLAAVSGSVAGGYAARLVVGIRLSHWYAEASTESLWA